MLWPVNLSTCPFLSLDVADVSSHSTEHKKSTLTFKSTPYFLFFFLIDKLTTN